MSWYVAIDGRQVWADRNELVYTVGDAPEENELPTKELDYLATATKQSVYAEHIIDDDCGDRRKKAKDKSAGRQRGFVVRVDTDSRTRVNACMQGAIDHLFANGTIMRLDIDESEKPKGRRRKNKDKDKDEDKEAEEAEAKAEAPLGVNECRVELKARIQHFAHGRGFLVVANEDGGKQRLHVFTDQALGNLPVAEMHRRFVEAIQHTGARAALGRMQTDEGPPKKVDEEREEEDDWLQTVMGRCMVSKPAKTREGGEAAGDGSGDGAVGAAGRGDAPCDEDGAAPKPKANLPPWLRRK